MKLKINFILSLLIILTTVISAQRKDYSGEPGYVDFGKLDKYLSGEQVTEIFIESHLLRMVGKLAEEEEPGFASLVEGLKLIKVNVFGVDEDNYPEIKDRAKNIAEGLRSEGWDNIASVREKDELVNVFIKTMNEDQIVGLCVMALEKKGDAAFVNIVGNIDLESIGKLGKHFDIPSLDSIGK